MNKRVHYLDYAAATPVCAQARDAYRIAEDIYANPGGLHNMAVKAKKVLNTARSDIARVFECTASEVVFVSGGTEANNLAIIGIARMHKRLYGTLTGTHWIVGSIEHDSVLEAFAYIESEGGEVTHLDPNTKGIYSPQVLAQILRPTTVLVSLGWANSEIGVVQPIAQLARVVREYEHIHGVRIYVHSDAGQAPLYEKTTFHTLGVDLLSIDSGKLYGPRGIGALIVKKGTPLAAHMFGGKQEKGLRPGTENVALAAGFAAAVKDMCESRAEESKRVRELRDMLWAGLQEHIPTIILNTQLEDSLPHMLNVSIPDVQPEYFILSLDREGIYVSTKSACREGEAAQSHVVASLGDGKSMKGNSFSSQVRASHTIRFSLGRETTEEDTSHVVDTCLEVYNRICMVKV